MLLVRVGSLQRFFDRSKESLGELFWTDEHSLHVGIHDFRISPDPSPMDGHFSCSKPSLPVLCHTAS